MESNLRQPSFKPVLPNITTATQNGDSERRLVRPAWMIGSPDCDWTEDADHENELYFNKCVCCACDFIGLKRRHVCKRCHAVGEAYIAGMTAEERAEWEANRDVAISEYIRVNGDYNRPVQDSGNLFNLNQPPVSREESEASILAQNGKLPSSKPPMDPPPQPTETTPRQKSLILTDPAKIREICLNQRRVSYEEAVASILEQNGKLPLPKPEENKPKP